MMNKLSISQIEQPINENIPTAIIYSICEIGDYIIEIRHHYKSYFVGSPEINRFGNLADAKQAARDHHAQQGYLALNKTYQETEISSKTLSKNQHRFDYLLIPL
jgi:hypothetical protein